MSLLNNFTSTSCAFWRAALARQQEGGEVATALGIGDSNSQDDTGLYMWHEQARAQLQSAAPDTWDDGFAYFTYPPPPAVLDPRRTLGTNWVITGQGQVGPGLNGDLSATAAGGTPFTYGPVHCDTFDLMFRRFGGGTFAWSIDDGPLSDPVSVAGSGDSGTLTIDAGAPGNHTLKLHALDTPTQPQFLGVAWTDSTAPRRRFAATGRFGSGTDLWADPLSIDAITRLGADLIVPVLLSNDYGFLGTTTEESLANLADLIDAAHANETTFILTIPAPSNYASPAPQPQPPTDLAAGMYALATEKDAPLVDLRVPFVDFATMQANGEVSDHVHFTNAGHLKLGTAMRQAIDAASGVAVVPPSGASGVLRAVAGGLVPASLYGVASGQLVPRTFARA